MTEPSAEPHRSSPAAVVVAAIAAAVAVAVVGFVLLRDGDDGQPLDVAQLPEETATTAPADQPDPDDPDPDEPGPDPVTTPTAPPPATPVDPGSVLFPDPHTSQRFDDPVSVAHSFATGVVGMQDPVLSELLPGDSRSGEVEIRPVVDGPVTVVAVRQMEDDTWFVIAAHTDEIRLGAPSDGDQVGNPVELRGEGRAFEGTIQVRVLADQHGVVGEGFVTGGGVEPAPFEGEVAVELPDGATRGLVVLLTEGGEELVPWTFTAARVGFAT
jgi:hypothetical protein